MPFVYLSPSSQEFNPYVGGGNEELYMNLIADQLERWFRACSISFVRNTTDMTAAQSIEASNAGQFSLHLALHSNAAPEALSGVLQGTDVYYSPSSAHSRRAAELIAAQLRTVYPQPEKVRALPTTTIGEVAKVAAPAVLVELAYHDNPEDAQWIRDNVPEIAKALAEAVAQYFSLPFLPLQPPRAGYVDLNWGSLNVRAAPDTASEVVVSLQDGTQLTVWNHYGNWFVVEWNGVSGFALQQFITLENE
ncbi:MAG: N-acetylmuramoyl-L-alanine amidase [Clostridiales bacterium]|nr:N-acetylmuramoyl-L-alanine amidase [Clostridiales bacterium]